MHDIIELAHNVIAGERAPPDHPTAARHRQPPGARHRVIWPPAPTVIKPSKLATVTTAIITALLQLRDAKRVWVSCPVQSLCLE
jgi:hypothetical protein